MLTPPRTVVRREGGLSRQVDARRGLPDVQGTVPAGMDELIEELPPVAMKDDIGAILLNPPPGGGIITPPQAPPPGGGGPNPPPPPPGEEPPPPPPPPAVPEPGTWATMLLGFGLTGWAMRRRRRQTTAALNLG